MRIKIASWALAITILCGVSLLGLLILTGIRVIQGEVFSLTLNPQFFILAGTMGASIIAMVIALKKTNKYY